MTNTSNVTNIHNGHEFVDLGLPSELLWATCNVGATSPEQDAAHANLGEKWRMPTKAEFQELIENTIQEWTDDYNGTGMAGLVFTSKTNGNSVFFPAGYCNNSSVNLLGSRGYYWSVSWESSYSARNLNFNSGSINTNNNNQYYGQSVRGVKEK